MDGRYYNLWSTDNDRTEANDDLVIKSVYDPSPVGFSLPASNAFTGFTTTGNYSQTLSEYNVKGNFDKGKYFYTKPNKQGNTVFLPAAGWRYDYTGSLLHVATYGLYWVAGPTSRIFGRYLSFSSGDIHPLNVTYRSYGFPVRSAEERETHKFNIKLEMDGRYYNLWSTDNDTTVPNDEVVIKSVYDPSPVGYSLPASNAFTGFTTTGQNASDWSNPLTPETKAKFNVKGDFDKGWYFYTKPNKQGNTFFFPASGYRDYNTSSLGLVTTNGYYWVAGPGNVSNGRYLDFGLRGVYPLDNTNRGCGFPVRSAEEKMFLMCIGGL